MIMDVVIMDVVGISVDISDRRVGAGIITCVLVGSIDLAHSGLRMSPLVVSLTGVVSTLAAVAVPSE
jgi:hypothetical protein